MAWACDIDGAQIRPLCQSIQWRQRLNAPASVIVRLPAHLFSTSIGDTELHLYENGNLVFSGPTWYVQGDGSPNSTYVEITAYDHLIHFNKRLCKTATGNLIDPTSVITTNVTGPAIMAAFLDNAINDTAALGTDPPGPASAALPLSKGSVDSGGDDLTSVPMNWPMTMEQMRSLLCSTGELNVLVSPGVGSSTVDFTNGGVVNDLTGSVSFEYATGAHNCQVATLTIDADDVINALWYLLGPRGPRKTKQGKVIPEDHWGGSITPTAPNSGGDGNGPLGPTYDWPPSLVSRFSSSRVNLGYMQEIRIYDDEGDEQDIRSMYERIWQREAWLRAYPQNLVSIRPQRGTSPTFGCGDMISVSAGSALFGGFSGAQIVFELEVQIDADGVVEVTDLITSPDQSDAP